MCDGGGFYAVVMIRCMDIDSTDTALYKTTQVMVPAAPVCT